MSIIGMVSTSVYDNVHIKEPTKQKLIDVMGKNVEFDQALDFLIEFYKFCSHNRPIKVSIFHDIESTWGGDFINSNLALKEFLKLYNYNNKNKKEVTE